MKVHRFVPSRRTGCVAVVLSHWLRFVHCRTSSVNPRYLDAFACPLPGAVSFNVGANAILRPLYYWKRNYEYIRGSLTHIQIFYFNSLYINKYIYFLFN